MKPKPWQCRSCGKITLSEISYYKICTKTKKCRETLLVVGINNLIRRQKRENILLSQIDERNKKTFEKLNNLLALIDKTPNKKVEGAV